MSYLHESIKFNRGLPVNIFTFKSDNPKRIIPKHWHMSSELIYCLSGSLVIWIESKQYVMHVGDVLIINPNEIHSSQSPEQNHVLVIQFPLEFLQRETDGKFLTEFEFNLNTINNQKRVASISHILNEIVNYMKQVTFVEKLELISKIYALLGEICACHTKKVRVGFEKSKEDLVLLGNIVGYIQRHYKESITLPEIAQHFGYSTSYFSRLFSKRMNITYSRYLKQTRLNKVPELLLNSKKTLLEIAMDTGFLNYRNFYNAFMSNYQMSPKQYRSCYQDDKNLHVYAK